MAIDLSTETVRTLSQAARRVPNRAGGRGVATSTTWRWGSAGVNGIKLETIMVGGTRCTSDEAMQRFFEAITAAADGTPTASTSRTPAARERAIAAAERELEQAGI